MIGSINKALDEASEKDTHEEPGLPKSCALDSDSATRQRVGLGLFKFLFKSALLLLLLLLDWSV